jgi:hypothetical protein
MNRFLLLFITPLFVPFSASLCAENNDYLPIGEGADWTMDLKMFQPDGKKLEGTGRRKIEGTVERDGKTYFKSKTWSEGVQPFSYEKLIRKDESGFYSIDEREPVPAEQTEVVLPLKVGASWETKMEGRTVQNKVVGIETVNIGDKTYEECFHIRMQTDDESYVEDYWEAPKVGSVKSIIRYPNGFKITLTLREFKRAAASPKQGP